MTEGGGFDPHSAAYLADPYLHLGALRAGERLHVDPATGHWFLLRFDDVEAGLAGIGRGDDPELERRHRDFPSNPFSADGPGHTGPRRVIMPTFSNRAVQQFRGRAQQIVDHALAGKERGGELRVVEEVGFPLPYHLTCTVLGVPDVDNRDELWEWTWRSLALIDVFQTPDELEKNMQAAAALAGHLRDVVAWKRNHLGDDLLSTILAAADEGEVLREDQLVSFIHTLYLAGMHTTVNQSALSLLALLRRRDQWSLLRDRPELLDNAVEELLRFEPTAQYMSRRPVTDCRVNGIDIPAGTHVVCWIASANRDEGYWGPTANELDITRADAKHHIAFGKGPHVCVGSWLARLELQVVVGTIVRRFPDTQLPEQDLVWTSNVIRGPEELVLQLAP
jgi:cytochrome P450